MSRRLHGDFVKTILLSVMSQTEQSPGLVRHAKILFAFLALVTFVLNSQAAAWQESAIVRIDGVDSSSFPVVIVNLVVSDAENNLISDLSGLRFLEDGIEIDDYMAEQLSIGSEIVFVIDANTSIEQRDEVDGLTRREKVRDSISRYANHFMDPVQFDRVSIIVPDGVGGRYLGKQGMSFPNEVVNAVNFYETGQLNNTPLDVMMDMALTEVEGSSEGPSEGGRFKAVFLFSDAGQIHEQLELQALTERAEMDDVAIYVAILGARADPLEVDNAALLSGANGGDYVHMAAPTATDLLYESIQGRGTRSQVTYRSQASESGQHIIMAEFNGSRDEAAFELNVEPPAVQMAVDNSRPIRRVAESAEAPLEEMEPQRQPLVAQVSWPDGHPRLLVSAVLLMNDVEIPLEAPVLDNAGLLTFDWDIRALEAGTYDLQVQLTDELGLQSVSEALPLVIEVQRPEAEATALPTSSQSSLPGGALALAAGAVALVAFLLAVAIGVFLVRRGRKGDRSTGATDIVAGPAGSPPGGQQADMSEAHIVRPDFVAEGIAGAYLEALENAPEHTGRIPITGSNVAVGRDQSRVQVAFQDKSVSRLHARIMENQGIYRILDEGSASGTYVNYERVGLTPRILSDKDDVHFGRVRLRFRLASSLSKAEATIVSDAPKIDATIVSDASEFDEDQAADTQLYEPPE
jgi:hypothetical protein